MTFKPGNPGRPKGARNRLTAALIRDLEEAWERDGPAALRVMAKEEPGKFAALCISSLPRNVEIERVLSDLPDDEIDALIGQIRARVLPPPAEPVLIEGKTIENPTEEVKVKDES